MLKKLEIKVHYMNNLLIVQELNKLAKSEYKGDAEVSVIQQIILLISTSSFDEQSFTCSLIEQVC